MFLRKEFSFFKEPSSKEAGCSFYDFLFSEMIFSFLVVLLIVKSLPVLKALQLNLKDEQDVRRMYGPEVKMKGCYTGLLSLFF